MYKHHFAHSDMCRSEPKDEILRVDLMLFTSAQKLHVAIFISFPAKHLTNSKWLALGPAASIRSTVSSSSS